MICQLAKREELSGTNPEDIIKIKTYEGVLNDFNKPVFEILNEADYEAKKDKKFDESFRSKLDGFSKLLKGKKWLLGDHLTVADFRAYNTFTALLKMYPETLLTQ